MLTVQDGMFVCFDYTLSLEDGQVIDSTEGGPALCYVHGAGQIIPGLEKALTGMAVGEERDIVVPAAEAYGEYEPGMIERLPREIFPPDVAEGMGFRMRNEAGDVIIVYAETVTDDWVEVNLAHPLAGKDLYFNVKITEVRPATEADLGGCNCGEDDCDECNG